MGCGVATGCTEASNHVHGEHGFRDFHFTYSGSDCNTGARPWDVCEQTYTATKMFSSVLTHIIPVVILLTHFILGEIDP